MTDTWLRYMMTIDPDEPLWEDFHANSRIDRNNFWLPDAKTLAQHFKETEQSRRYRGRKRIALPAPRKLDTPLQETIEHRRSQRDFAPTGVQSKAVASLLNVAYGLRAQTEQKVKDWPFHQVPSGGALYPLEIYLFSERIEGLDRGLYHFEPMANEVSLLRTEESNKAFAKRFTQPELIEQAAGVAIISAVFERTTFKYGERGYRFALIEAGHVGQNLLLAATALGLASCPIGGYIDQELDEYLEFDGFGEGVIYCIAFGQEAMPNKEDDQQSNG